MTKRPRRSSKSKSAVRPPVIDLKAEEATPGDEMSAVGETVLEAVAEEASVAETAMETAAPDADIPAPADEPADEPGAEPGETPPPPPEQASSAGRGKLIAAGLALLVIAAIGIGGWLYRDYGAKIFGGPQTADITALENRLSAMESAGKANADELAALAQSIPALTDSVATLETRLTALETTSTGLAADLGVQKDAGAESLAGVEKSISDLRTALSVAASAGDGGSAGQASNKLLLDELTAKLSGLTDRIGQAETTLKSAPEPVEDPAVGALQSKLAALEKTLGALRERNDQQAMQTSSTLSGAFAKLSSSVTRSGPFAAELDALAAEAPATPGMDILRPLAATGVASHADLASQLGQMATSISAAKSAASEAQAAEGGLLDALKAKMQTVVKVRKIGEVDWPAVLATAAAQVKSGELQRAMDLIAGQTGDAPDGMDAWTQSANNRLKADQAMRQLSKAILNRLAQTGQNG